MIASTCILRLLRSTVESEALFLLLLQKIRDDGQHQVSEMFFCAKLLVLPNIARDYWFGNI